MRTIAALVAGLAVATAAQAQLVSNFEPPTYSGSAAGSALTNGFGLGGQDGWYNPVAGSNDGVVFTYTDNAWGFVRNRRQRPVRGSNTGATGFGRPARGELREHDPHRLFDINLDRLAACSAINNLGSFTAELGHGPLRQTLYLGRHQHRHAFDANYVFFNAAGVQQANTLPGPEWNALNLNTWYRQSTTWDFVTNRILSVSIDNLHDAAGPTVVDVSGPGWYLAGGENPTQALPTDIRFFAGGGANNVHIMGFDNIEIVPAPASALLLGLGGLVAGRRRRA